MMAKERVEREERAQQQRIADEKRREEAARRQLILNRVRKFTELAVAWRDHQVARDFLNALKSNVEPDVKLSGNGIDDWIGWMEEALAETNPMVRGAEYVLGQVAEVQTWTYRD